MAASYEFEAGPFRSVLLDEPLVVWRDHDGAAVVAPDRCPHRGAALSGGHLVDGQLQCPYHGFRFDGSGRCTLVPSSGPTAAISRRLDLEPIRAVERHGLIWVLLSGDELAPLPNWNGIDEPGRQWVMCAPTTWQAAALRHAENFCDQGHFPYIHAATFGSAEEAEVPPIVVTQDEHELHFELDTVQVLRDTFDSPGTEATVHYEYRWAVPFATWLSIDYGEGRTERIADVAAPVTRGTSRVYLQKSRDYDLDQPVEPYREFQDAINEEDRRIVESLQPAAPPLDLAGEVHVRADVVSIAARRWFAERLGGVSSP